MKVDRVLIITVLAAFVSLCSGPRSALAQHEAILRDLNNTRAVAGSAAIKSYELLFDAYLQMTPPPFPISADFNLKTIHPGMREWQQVAGWAESNAGMARAVIEAKSRRMIGLPYGRNNVKASLRDANLVADIGANGSLRDNRFPYLSAVDVIAAFVTAEAYRRFEAGQTAEALELMLAHLVVCRQFCDREFFVEKRHSLRTLDSALANMRDMMYLYHDRISSEQYVHIAASEIPFLRPDRNALFMPEGDRVLSEALIKEVFDSRGQADRSKFPSTFAAIQASEAPLTQFGAAKRWAMIAEVHGSLDASLERLTLVYDDWWRRWRVQEYDPILDVPTQFSRVNPVRYAAVIYSMQNIEELFNLRKQLVVGVNGTALAAGLCAYRKTFGVYPSDHKMMYAQFVRKSSDIDPYDRSFGPMLYLLARDRRAIDTSYGRIWVEPNEAILYSIGQNHTDELAQRHTDDGINGDIVVWPPVTAVARQQQRR